MGFEYTTIREKGARYAALVVRWIDAFHALGHKMTEDDEYEVKGYIIAAGGPQWVMTARIANPTTEDFLLIKNEPM